VREKKTTLPADVVPCFEYHYIYDLDSYGRPVYQQGTRIYPETGPHVHNWSQQQLTNGVAKNDATGRRYKRMVRALKRLETFLVQRKLIRGAPSFLMECLVYNVRNDLLNNSTYVADMRAVLARIFNATRTDDECKDWLEVSELKYLLHRSQPWTRQQAHELASAAWDIMELG
jgi:hypothetical protein